MFGFPRLARLLAEPCDDSPTIDALLGELTAFTGDGWEQEDDITLVTLRYVRSLDDSAGRVTQDV